MAHAATVKLSWLGSMDFKIVISETDAGIATTKVIDLTKPEGEASARAKERQIPEKFRLLGVMARQTSGTGTTLAPALEKDIGSTTYQDLLAATADAEPVAMSAAPILVHVEGGFLRHAVTMDAGTDNVTRTEYLCRRGWFDSDFDLASGEQVR